MHYTHYCRLTLLNIVYIVLNKNKNNIDILDIFSSKCFTFHVRLVVEVGHLPAIFLVVVVMCVRRVVRRRYGLCVRCRAVVEVDLGPGLVVSLGHQLLGLFDALRPSTDHPHEQRDDDEEHDSSRDTASDVCEVRLVFAVGSDERSDTTARWLTT